MSQKDDFQETFLQLKAILKPYSSSFKMIDKGLFKELSKLTRAGFEKFSDAKFLLKITNR
ncbi:MAG: hypothetical protein M3Y84_03110 [Acidobacteriota bacterium]|nr:hypothetical protein [Acidobacteriota bacterium]